LSRGARAPVVWSLRASNTHLYPGARLGVAQGDDFAPRRGDALLIEFADLGVAQGAVVAVEGDRVTLAVEPHRTRRGTLVAARQWIVEPAAASTERETRGWRVAGRVGAHAARR
jgi:hypothetical protein